MTENLTKQTLYYNKEHSRNKIRCRILTVLAAVVVFCTTYALIIPAITMTQTCGKVEHVHTDECYAQRVRYFATVLNCPYDEHTHGSSCYNESGDLVCTKKEHVHSDGCFGDSKPVYEKYLTCTLEEHVHNELCYDSIFRPKLLAIKPTGGSGTIEWKFTPMSDGSYKLYVGGSGAIPSEFYLNEDLQEALTEIEASGNTIRLVIGKDITSIGSYAFYDLNMVTSLEFEDYSACTSIGGSAFRACAILDTVTFPEHNSLKSIAAYGFYRNSALKNVNLEACTSLESIGDCGFAEYNVIESIKLPANVKTLGTSCFASCASLTTCDLTDCVALAGIPQTCFLGDSKLKEIFIPASCTYIKAQAFQNCYALETVDFAPNYNDQFVFYQRCFAMVGEAKNHTALKNFNMENLGTCGSVGMYQGSDTFGMFMYGGPENIIIPSNFVGGVGTSNKNSLYCLFHYATNVKHITFLENNNPLKLDNTAFAHAGIYELDLRPLKNVTGTIGSPFYGGTGTLDPMLNVETFYLPEKATAVSGVYSCPNLKYIIFPDGSAVTKIGGFNKCDNLEEFDFSDLEKLKTITDAFHDDEKLSVIILPNNGENILLDGTFYNDPALVDVDLTDTSVYQLSRVFYNDINLKRVALPTTFLIPYGTAVSATQPDGYIHKGIFYNDPNLEDLYINSVHIRDGMGSSDTPHTYWYSEDSFTNCGPFVLHFGPDVDRLPIEFLQDASRSCGAIIFAGNNNITFTKNEETEHKGAKLPSMLRDLEGEYYADASGALYKLNDDGTATLVYVPPFIHGTADDDKWGETPLTSYTIPATITDANGDTYSVTAVESDAFLLAENLDTLNGETVMDDANTALDALGYPGVDLNNTLLIGADHYDDQIYDYDYPHRPDECITDDPIDVSDTHYEIDDEGELKKVGTKLTITTNDRVLYTNESSKDANNPTNIVVSLGNTLSGDSKIARVFFCFSEPGYIFVDENLLGVEQSSTTGDTTFNYTINRVEGTDFYYLDIGPVPSGATGSLDFQPLYPSPNTPGGKLLIWGELIDDPDTEPTVHYSNTTDMHEIEWITVPDPFNLTKTAGTGQKIVQNHSEYYVYGLNYTLTLNREGSAISYGKNYISTVDFTDVLTLPDEVVWRDGVLNAITNGDWRLDRASKSTQLYVTVGGEEYLVATIGVSNLVDLVPSVENGKLKLDWTLKNTSATSEFSMGTASITFGNDVLRLSNSFINPLQPDETIVIHNDADAFIRYRYDDATYDPAPAEADVSLTTGAPDVTVTKTQSRKSGYWGESQTFTITTNNTTLFPYEGMLNVTDPLTNIYYIKPADLARMFAEDTFKELTVTINNATICDSTYVRHLVTTIDGEEQYMTSIVNSSQWADNDYADQYYIGLNGTVGDIAATQQNVIKIHWNAAGDALVFDLYPNASASSPVNSITLPAAADGSYDAASALEALNYMPTNNCTYKCEWDHSADRQTVESMESRTYKIYATFKDTFAFLANDLTGTHKTSGYGNAVYNTATVNVLEGAAKTSKISTNTFQRELSIAKDITQNGAPIGDGNQLRDETPLNNTLTINHKGTGRYDLFPIVDRMTGSQLLMAKVSDNEDAAWAAGLTDIVTSEGEDYYVLGIPAGQTYCEYRGVWVGGYYADTVEVTKTATGFSTLIKWYLADAFGKTVTMTIEYPTYVSCSRSGTNSSSFNGNNQVWLGDHPTHRLYASFGVGGTDVNFNKYIIDNTGSPVKYSVIYRGGEVLYRLRLVVSGSGTITGSDLYDRLPLTYGDFAWTTDNVSIERYEYDPAVVTLTGGDAWQITQRPTGQPTAVIENGLYYINWGTDDPSTTDTVEGFSAAFRSSGTLDIYVRLTFPADAAWDAFCRSLGGNQIENTMWFQELPDSVSHDVIAPAAAKLQKGVYDTGFMTNMKFVSTGSYPYVIRKNSKVYTNSVNTSQGRVTYYADLYNDGPGKLYLDTIQDILPTGFTFFSLTNAKGTAGNVNLYPYAQLTVGSKIGYTTALTERTKYTSTNDQVGDGYYHTYSETSYKANPLSKVTRSDAKAVEYVVAQITVDTTMTTSDGRKILRFTVDGDNSACTIAYDETVGRYYLKPGQCLRFGYDAKTNKYADTKDNAPNYMAMPVFDPYDAGVSLSTNEAITTTNTIAPNDGTAQMISNSAAHDAKFDGGSANTRWLYSEVTVRRDPIQPGINKRDTFIINSSGDKRVSAGNVGYGETVVWDADVTNTGESPMINYSVTDTMPAPFRFTGPVYFELFEESGLQTGTYAHGSNSGSGFSPILSSGVDYQTGEKRPEVSKTYPLFTLTRDDSNNCFITDGTTTYQLTSGQKVRIGGTGGVFTSYTMFDHCVTSSGYGTVNHNLAIYDHVFDVTWSRDADGNETLNIDFVNDLFAIPARGTLWLQYRTQEFTNSHENKNYVNQAWVTPTQEFDPDAINIGNYDETPGAPSVYDDEPVSVVSGYITSADKSVTEIIHPDNTASTETSVKWILLESADSLFRYTLNVHGTSSNDMDRLVLIDNLPEVNDHSTFALTVPRSSAFNVSFADDPDVSVSINGVELSPLDYEITYSTRTGFNDNDWAGGNASGYWGALTSGSRSIRLVIDNVPKGSLITLKFTAKITDKELAQPGTIAWNNFGYSYVIGGATLQASPSNVGIRVPSVPKLQKKLVLNEAPYAAQEDANFTFCVYTGDPVDNLYSMTEAEIAAALTGREYHFVTLHVDRGDTESALLRLEEDDDGHKLSTFWVNGDKYSITELDPGADYRYSDINKETGRTFSFTYRNDTNLTLTATNLRRVWKILLSKTDSKETDIMLPGAVFGLYSPNADDLLPADDIGDFTSTVTRDGVTYYLSSVKTTDTYGMINWNTLFEDGYVVKELIAPKGYYLDETLHLLRRDDSVDDVVEVNYVNECSYALPSTGGIGSTTLYAAAFVLMAFGALLGTVTFVKTRKKTGEND
ncbi:MAG: leucine-rich repeat protein [Lachnospiraceae bacterium]|nr:leucine-rich repeat protein [Lachnospiraceae bacterium]